MDEIHIPAVAANKENSGSSLPGGRRVRYGPSENFQRPCPLWDDAQYVYCGYGVILREYLGAPTKGPTGSSISETGGVLKHFEVLGGA